MASPVLELVEPYSIVCVYISGGVIKFCRQVPCPRPFKFVYNMKYLGPLGALGWGPLLLTTDNFQKYSGQILQILVAEHYGMACEYLMGSKLQFVRAGSLDHWKLGPCPRDKVSYIGLLHVFRQNLAWR